MSNQPRRTLADMLQDLDDLDWNEPVPGGFIQVPARHGMGCRWVPDTNWVLDPLPPMPPPPPPVPLSLPPPPPPVFNPPPLPYLEIPPPAVRRTHPTGVVPDDAPLEPPRSPPSMPRQDILRASTTAMQAAIQAWTAVIGRELDADEVSWLSNWTMTRNDSGRRIICGTLFVTRLTAIPFRAVACQGQGTQSSEYYVVLYLPADGCPRAVRLASYDSPILSMLGCRDEILRRGYSAGPQPARVWPGFPARATLANTEAILGVRNEDWRLLFEGGLDLLVQRTNQRRQEPVFPTMPEPAEPTPVTPTNAPLPISVAFGSRRQEDRRRVPLPPERRREIAALLNSDDDDENPAPTGSVEFVAPQPVQRVLRIPVAPKPDDA